MSVQIGDFVQLSDDHARFDMTDADGHVAAVRRLETQAESFTVNLGTGKGYRCHFCVLFVECAHFPILTQTLQCDGPFEGHGESLRP